MTFTLRYKGVILFASLLVATVILAQEVVRSAAMKTIISPTIPRDSRGETVYEGQGKQREDLPVVPGVLSPPAPVKLPEPKYPKSLRRTRSSADVVVEGVITSTGDFIDTKVIGPSDSEASTSALEATSRYKFTPATLDGKPVAVLLRVTVSFRIK